MSGQAFFYYNHPLGSYTPLQARVRARLEQWRLNTINNLGYTPDQIDYCCRNNAVMHDIFLDAIARSASEIRCREDFENVAYYWHWVDRYGSEVFDAIRDELCVTKRGRDDSYDYCEPVHAPAQRKRVRV
jgi:hypothetical protein